MNKLIIAVDFDGTICINNTFPEIGQPRMWLIELLKSLKLKGHRLILWTCRENKPFLSYPDRPYLDDAVAYCKQYGLEFDAINTNIDEDIYPEQSRKIYADFYIDDKSVLLNDLEKELHASLELSRLNGIAPVTIRKLLELSNVV